MKTTLAITPGEGWPPLSEVLEILAFRGGFNTSLVVAGTTLLGLAAGLIGVFALLRKRSLMTDALAHATLPGIGLAFLAATSLGFEGRSLPVLLAGAATSGVLGVLAIQALLRYTRLREDAAIGIVLSVFFGAGVVVLSYVQNPANVRASPAGLNHFIYGQTAALQPYDVAIMGAITLGAILATSLFLKEFALVCFNDAFAKVDGWPVSMIDLLMMALVVVVTVAGLQAVGLILVVAMLIIPPVTARLWTDRLRTLLIIAAIVGAASGYFGSVVSALLPRKPAGSVIVLTSGAIFAVSLVVAPSRGVVAGVIKRARLGLRIAGDHLLEEAHERAASSLSADTVREIARLRGWSAPIARGVCFWLSRAGFARRDSNGGIEVTERGSARGARVSRNHALWEQYLISYADVAPSHVDWSVDQVEHVLSDELIDDLERALAKRGVILPPAGTPT